MLDAAILSQLSAHFEKLAVPVEFVFAPSDSATSAQMRALLDEISSLSPKLSVLEQPGGRSPAFEVRRSDEPAVSVTFAGLPMGHEFSSLVLAVLQVGGHPAKLPDRLIEQIRELEGPLRFETFFSQSCQNCPDVVQALNLLAILNPEISHVAIDGAAFQEEAERRGVQSVPAVFLNGEVFGFGRTTLEEIVARLDSSSADRERDRLSRAATFDVLVVGAGPAGAAAAVYSARKGVRTGIVADRVGGQVLDTMAIENLISVPHTEGPALARALESHVRCYEVDMMVPQRAVQLVPGDDENPARVVLENGATLAAHTVVLSPGAHWRTMGVPGEDEYRNKGVTFCPHCDGPLFKGKRVAVVGGGNSGVEAAIDLAGLAGHVTLIEFGSELRADAVLQQAMNSLANVTVVTDAQTTEILGNGATVTGLSYLDRQDATLHSIAVDGVFVQIGLSPNTDWLRGVVELSERGEIVVDDKGGTSVAGVFAAGDATTVPYKQIIIAAGAGATAALGAFDHLIRSTHRAGVAAV